jgi:Flp pilus assembly protein TadD
MRARFAIALMCLGLPLIAGCNLSFLRVEKSAEAGAARPVSGKPAATSDPAARATYDQALALMDGGYWDAAEKVLLTMTTRYPELAGPNVNLGIVYMRQNRSEDAEQVLKKAVALNPDSAPAHNQLGILYRRAGRFDEARTAYEKALAAQPGYDHVHRNLGILYDLYLGQPRQALQHYERCQTLPACRDKQVDLWIVELKRRLGNGSGNAQASVR